MQKSKPIKMTQKKAVKTKIERNKPLKTSRRHPKKRVPMLFPPF